MISEESTTCVIAFLAYTMHSSFKSIEIKKEDEKRFFKNSMMYDFGLPLLFTILMISYDVGTDAYQHVILPNGHCSFIPGSPYVMSKIALANSVINRVLQVLLFVVYSTYYYRAKNALKLIRRLTDKRINFASS